MLKLGKLELGLPFLQAPLSGYSDYAMRKLAKDHGAPLTFAGVMLAKSAAHPKIMGKEFFRPHEDEHPVGGQILGDDWEICVKAAVAIEKAGFDIVDLNFACPAPKVLRRGRAGAMLCDPKSIMETYRRVRESVSVPLTTKIRIGVGNGEEDREKYWQLVEMLAEEGADAVMIHGRSVNQKYRGEADWETVAETKRRYPGMTILGSGDVFDAVETVKIVEESGVDGVVVARGAIGNPWIFRELEAVFNGENVPEKPSVAEQREVILRHYEMVMEIYDGDKAVRYLRKFLVNYCKLHPDRRKTQASLLGADDHDELVDAIEFWYN